MTRALSEELLLFFVPFVLFALWLVVRRRKPLAWVHWDGNVSWLVIAGLVVALGWIVFTGLTAQARHGRLCAGAHGERRLRASPDQMNAGLQAVRLPPGSFIEAAPVQAVLGILDRDGEEARVVGGAVRNALLGVPAAISTSPPPPCPRGRSRARRAAGMKAVPTGIEHGTVTVVARRPPFEVTTLREDVETDGRHAMVVFGRDFAHGRQAARLHHERALCRHARRHRGPCRRHRGYRGAACALHRRSRAAHPRGLPAHPAPVPLPRALRLGSARCRRPCTRRSSFAAASRASRPSASAPSC